MPYSNASFSICLVTDTLCDANGVSRFIQDIAKQSIEKDKALYIFTATNKQYCQKLDNISILKPLFSVKMPFYPDLDLVIFPPFLQLYYAVKSIQPDVLHISTPGTMGLSALLIAKILKIPVMGTYHTDFPAFIYSNVKRQSAKMIADWYMKFFYSSFQKIFIRSHMYRNIVKETLEVEDTKLATIPVGIDRKRFNPALRNHAIWSDKNVPSDAVKALYVGRMTKEKNIPFLLDIWQKIYKKNPNIWLILVGTGEYYNQKELYEKYHIKFLGHQEGVALATIYASCDLFVFPSLTDTLGQVVIEAMVSGLPALVSDQGGPQTLINTVDENGFVLPGSDASAWIDMIDMLCKDRRKLNRLSYNAFKTSYNLTISKSFDYFWKVSQEK